jgi:hypothetical protein
MENITLGFSLFEEFCGSSRDTKIGGLQDA